MEKVIVAVVTTILSSAFEVEDKELQISGKQVEEIIITTCGDISGRSNMYYFRTSLDPNLVDVLEVSPSKN